MEHTDTLSTSPADVLKEKQRLIDILKIPISNLVFSRFYCEVFLSQHSIGFLSISQSSTGTQYEISRSALQKLNWAKVYSLNQAELNEEIRKQIRKDSFHVVPASFRRLYIEDQENQLIASFECAYENFLWNITNESILAPNE